VTIARLVEKKGVEYGIRAVAKLVRAKLSIEYHVIGDGPLREDLRQLIQELDANDTVKLLGWKQQQEVVEILNNAHIMLAPSVTSQDGDQEGIPVSLMEAMARGLPIVSTQHSGIPELIENGVSGFLVPEQDVDALAEKLGYLIEHPEVWPEMGRAGRVYVEKHYDINKLNNQLVEIYQKLLTD
jgi:colanic acid/amylovoran biosynthesis glycosyltransferase